MNVEPEYNVRLGEVARTIFHEDAQGAIRFTFDMETVNGQATIIWSAAPKQLSNRNGYVGISHQRRLLRTSSNEVIAYITAIDNESAHEKSWKCGERCVAGYAPQGVGSPGPRRSPLSFAWTAQPD